MAHETISLVKAYHRTCLISSGVKNPFESLSRISKALSKISASEDGNLELKKKHNNYISHVQSFEFLLPYAVDPSSAI
jgi:hypothetical protein